MSPASRHPGGAASPGTVAIVTLGCARNEVDSEELASRLVAEGWTIVDDAQDASAVLVNTCGFVEAAKKDSIDTVLALSQAEPGSGPGAPKVVAVGCLAERYGRDLASALPEADAVLGFDDYPAIDQRLRAVLAGERLPSHQPTDRRKLLPITPVERNHRTHAIPGHGQASDAIAGWQPPVLRHRLDGRPVAPLKLASGCDRRCAFCAIPSFRGSFVSRPADQVLAEAAWLAEQGVREVVLVSENSTSYGKDLGDLRLLESVLPALAQIDGIDRIRVAYLQPAEMRPSLVEAIAATDGVAAYFDLSFQHASGPVLRRMRRFGDAEAFLALVEQVRARVPEAGIRSNVIVGFPGESEADVDVLVDFLQQARLDAVGVFGYSDEEGTEAATMSGKLPEDEVRARVEHVATMADELMVQRAEDRIGERVRVLIEAVDADAPGGHGRADHQGPDDGSSRLTAPGGSVGDLVLGTVVDIDGVDLVVDPA